MRLWLIKMALAIGCVFVLPACALVPYRGYVVDAETKEPVKDAVVFIEFDSVGLGGGSFYGNAAEGLTDEKGYFSVPYKGWSFNPWRMLWTDTLVTFFKSGYEPPVGSSWGALMKYEWGYPKGTLLWKIENGKPFILLKKASTDREKRLSDLHSIHTSGVPPEKRQLLENEIQKELEILYPCLKEKTCQ